MRHVFKSIPWRASGITRYVFLNVPCSGTPFASCHWESMTSVYALPSNERATHLIARQHTAFDPAGIEQDGESASFPIPQLLIKFQEGQIQRLVIPVQ